MSGVRLSLDWRLTWGRPALARCGARRARRLPGAGVAELRAELPLARPGRSRLLTGGLPRAGRGHTGTERPRPGRPAGPGHRPRRLPRARVVDARTRPTRTRLTSSRPCGPGLTRGRPGGLPRPGVARVLSVLALPRGPVLPVLRPGRLPGVELPGLGRPRLPLTRPGRLPGAGASRIGTVLSWPRRPCLSLIRSGRLPGPGVVDARARLSLTACPALSWCCLPRSGVSRVLGVLPLPARPALARCGATGARCLPGSGVARVRPVRSLLVLARPVLARTRRAGRSIPGRPVSGCPEGVRPGALMLGPVPRRARFGCWLTRLTGSWPPGRRPGLLPSVLVGSRLTVSAGAGHAAVLVLWLASPSTGGCLPVILPRPRPLGGLAVLVFSRPVGRLRVALARLPGWARLSGRPSAAAARARAAGRLLVLRSATVEPRRPRTARGSRGTAGGNPPRVRHDGLLRRRTAAAGRLWSGPLGCRAPDVCLAAPGPWSWPASGRLRCCFFWPWPWAVRCGGIAWRLPRRPGREPWPWGHAALRAGAGRARRQVGRTGPVAGAASVAGVNRIGAGVQGGASQLRVLRVAAVGGFGSPATRAPAWAGRGKRAALTIHPVPPACSPRSAWPACGTRPAIECRAGGPPGHG